jgi:hypothetical protein
MENERDYMLSTIDNPFNPFDDFDAWLQFDKEKGHHCCERLARIAQISDDMTDLEKDLEYERAMDEIIRYDIFGVYIKVTPKTVPLATTWP